MWNPFCRCVWFRNHASSNACSMRLLLVCAPSKSKLDQTTTNYAILALKCWCVNLICRETSRSRMSMGLWGSFIYIRSAVVSYNPKRHTNVDCVHCKYNSNRHMFCIFFVHTSSQCIQHIIACCTWSNICICMLRNSVARLLVSTLVIALWLTLRMLVATAPNLIVKPTLLGGALNACHAASSVTSLLEAPHSYCKFNLIWCNSRIL